MKWTYKNTNNALGWLFFLIALVVYMLTIEREFSFWDCGEYIASAAKLEVTHSPGAALFQLVGAVFTGLSFGDSSLYSLLINALSGLFSALTILFLFWTITHFSKKLLETKTEGKINPLTKTKKVTVFLSGALGALTFTFTDTFWYSATEGEVYSMASLFVALLVWLSLKWEADESVYSDKWMILIGFVIGLSIGVHLMAILAVPLICYIYYFKKYEFNLKSFLLANLVALMALVFTLKLLFPLTMSFFGALEVFFVNGLYLPFHSGTIVAFVLLIVSVYSLLRFTSKAQIPAFIYTLSLVLVYMLIGFSSWLMIPIRANANPPMNLNNPDTAIGLLDYYNREQYGEWPVMYGENYTAYLEEGAISYEKSGEILQKDEKLGRYIKVGDKSTKVVDSRHVGFFPKMYNPNPRVMEEYARMTGYPDFTLNQEENGIPFEMKSEIFRELQKKREEGTITIKEYLQAKGVLKIKKPTLWQNLDYFFNFQINYMYVRYFLWNFVGRQNDLEGKGEHYKGNWMSGIDVLDEYRLGKADFLPSDLKNNKGHNVYFFLPFLLGLIGLVYQARKKFGHAYALFSLFALAGVGIIIYTSVKPFEPRERDYALVGSFYVFSIWIGLSAVALFDFFQQKKKVAYFGFLLLAVPIWMGFQNWDDHDRSERKAAYDLAINYLSEIDHNGILFTFGDNDTYPLWAIQETNHFRDDVKVVHSMLFSTDWNIEQNQRKTNNSEALPMSFTKKEYVSGKNEYVHVLSKTYLVDLFDQLEEANKSGGFKGTEMEIVYANVQPLRKYIQQESMTAKEAIAWLKADLPEVRAFLALLQQSGSVLPVNKITIPVNKEKVLASGLVPAHLADQIVDEISFELKTGGLSKYQLMLLDILANFDWDRSIYFSAGGIYDEGNVLFLTDYLQYEGFVYKLLPILTLAGERADYGRVNADKMYERIKNLKWANYNVPSASFDETSTRNILSYRNILYRGAESLLLSGQREKAVEILDLGMEKIPQKRYPDTHSLVNMMSVYLLAGKEKKAIAILDEYVAYNLSYLRYFQSLDQEKRYAMFEGVRQREFRIINALKAASSSYDELGQTDKAMDVLERGLKQIDLDYKPLVERIGRISREESEEMSDVKYLYTSLYQGVLELYKPFDETFYEEKKKEILDALMDVSQ